MFVVPAPNFAINKISDERSSSDAAHEGPVSKFQKSYYRIPRDEKSSNRVIHQKISTHICDVHLMEQSGSSYGARQ